MLAGWLAWCYRLTFAHARTSKHGNSKVYGGGGGERVWGKKRNVQLVEEPWSVFNWSGCEHSSSIVI